MSKSLRQKMILPMAASALAIFAAVPAIAKTCDLDTVPAATLLLPYFEVDVSSVVPPLPPRSVDTAFSVLNTKNQARIAHVTLWTEWAIPTVSFDLVLGPYDEQSINVIDLLIGGAPDSQAIAGCTGTYTPGVMHFNGALPVVAGDLEANLATLRRAHTGEAMDTPTGARVASASHPGLAKGYITIDVVRQCTALNPASSQNSGYFVNGGAGIATNDNALSGDYLIVDLSLGISMGEPLVHIRADKTFEPPPGQTRIYTFYSRYVGGKGTDDRQPLGNVYASRFWTWTPDPLTNPQTWFVVWRDTKSGAPVPYAVGSAPPALPLRRFMGCDEDRNCTLYSGSLPLATQRTAINIPGGIRVPYTSGWMRLDLNHQRTSLFGSTAQGYVTTLFSATAWSGGNMASGFRATRLQTPCTP